jgi:hypothetical protein
MGMGRKVKTHCKRGHVLNEYTTRPKKLTSGHIVRQCKRCRALLDSMRYASQPKRQASIRHAARLRYLLGPDKSKPPGV